MRNSELAKQLEELSKELAALSRRVEAVRMRVVIEGVFFNPTTPDHSGELRDRQLDAKPASKTTTQEAANE